MQRLVFLTMLFLASVSVSAQNKDTLNISITNYKLVQGTYSWRGNDQFHDMTSWDSSPYQQGHLKQGTQFRMNFRLLHPQGYNPAYRPGYPLIVMLHGAGERGNCWNDNCYCADASQCNPNNEPVENTDLRFLNNDHQLVHGGSPHLSARNRAGTKLPDDPTLVSNAFPGFVLFPQNTNQWRNSGSPASSDVSNAIRIVRLLSRQYNIDQDRIYVHGLSMGAQALLEALNYADWLFAAAAPMSPINFSQSLEYDSVRNIPFWIFQGGQDLNPKPAETEGMIEQLREKGATVRYSLYPNLGHGTWNTAYAEPDFFSWLLSKNKANIHVDYGKPNVCATTGEGASLLLPQGFPAYQWERDGELIDGAVSHHYVANVPGVYRARYSRVSTNPLAAQWNRWSDPVMVGERSPEAPEIEQLGTNILSDLNVGSVAYLKVPPGFEKYHWFQNGQVPQKALVQSPEDPTVFTHTGCTGGGYCVHSGQYTLITEGYDKCPSLPSDPVTILFGTHNTVTVPPAITGTPGNFTFDLKSSTSVLLKWNDNSTNERGFEIWRRKLLNEPGEDFNKGWVMATITREDVTMFLDTGLQPATTYYYKIRAVNNAGRSNYFPGNAQANINHNRVVTTGPELVLPTPPTDLFATTVGPGVVRLTWTPSSDNSGIQQYYIYFNGDSIATGNSECIYTVTGLGINQAVNFYVRAIDAAGNLSSQSNPSNAHTYVTGLYYKHSTGAWSSMSEMTDTWVNPEFTGWVSTFSLQERTQDDFFNFEFQGFLFVDTPGVYAFRTVSDDGSQLYLNNALIVNNDGLHGSVTVTSADQTLSAGPVPIMVRYFENTGGQTLTVQYRGADTGNVWVNIPSTSLRSGNAPALPIPPPPPSSVSVAALGLKEARISWTYPATKIVILGSSTAFGTGASPAEKSWVNLLSNWLTENTIGATVSNLALGGFDTEDVLPTGDPQRNIEKALSLSPDLIIVNLPSNDVANGIPVATTMLNLKTLKSLAEQAGVRIFFTTTQPRNFSTQAEREKLQQTAEEIRNAFADYTIEIYDELTNLADLTIKPMYNTDGVHVNNEGHAFIFSTVKKKVLQHLPSFEVQRSVAESGPFVATGRSYADQYLDTELMSNQIYYFRVRTTLVDTVSQFSPTVSTQTLADTQAPSVPGTPALHRAGYATLSITWPASADDAKVLGYEIYSNGTLVGTSQTNAYQINELLPQTNYTITIVAYDAAGNKSVPSQPLIQQTSSGTIFYSQAEATQLNQLTSWKTETGITPSSFSDNGQVFVIRHSLPVGGPWKVEGTVSKVVIDGVPISINIHPIDAVVDIAGPAVLNLQSAATPRLGTLSPESRVRYSTAPVQRADYGHLELVTPDTNYEFEEGITKIRGNLLVADGSAIRGATGNATTLNITGNISMTGIPPTIASSYAVSVHLVRAGNQTITTASGVTFYQLTKEGSGVISIDNTGSPITLTLGSSLGGGLTLRNGTRIDLASNSLTIQGAGNINGENQSGAIEIAGGDIHIISTSSETGHLYFATSDHQINRFRVDKPGALMIHSGVNIGGSLKVIRGTLHSGGNISMISQLGTTANIEEIENNGSITGSLTIQESVAETGGAVRFITPAVRDITIEDWQRYFPVTGNFVGASAGPGADPSLFAYTDPDWIAYPLQTNPSPFNNNGAPAEMGKGYAAYIHNVAPVLMESTGEISQGDTNLPVVASPSGSALTGWNLVGNPMPSKIQWNTTGWTSNNVSSVIAVPVRSGNMVHYDYFDSHSMTGTAAEGELTQGHIRIGQAFMVRAIGPSPGLTARESSKVGGLNEDYTPASHIRVILSQDLLSDVALIAITANATDAFDNHIDGLKKSNEDMFSFSTLSSDDVSLAINNSGDEFCAKAVKFNIENALPGTFRISTESLTTLNGIESVKLVDHFTNTTTDLSEITAYSFQITTDPMSSGKERFELILSRADLNLSVTSEVRTVCNEPVQIKLSNTQAGTWYGVFGTSGKELSPTTESAGGDIVIELKTEDLVDGENTVIIKASYPGCSSAALPQTISFTHYHAPDIAASNVLVCSGEAATLELTSSSAVATFQWALNGLAIPTQHAATLVTGPVMEELYYSVQAIQPNGCKSPIRSVTVTPVKINEPVIMQDDESISVNVIGDEYEWRKNGDAIAVTNEPTFAFSGAGAYSVVVRVGDCSRTSQEFIVTGFPSEHLRVFTINVYPNPTRQAVNLRVTSASSQMVGVRLTDLTGRVIIEGHYYVSQGEDSNLLLNEGVTLSPGIYFINVELQSKRRSIKVLVE